MNALDVLTSPWAITPESLRTICEIYDRHLRGETVDLDALEASLGKPLKNEPQGYTVEDGVATIPIEGVITKRANLFTRISGGVSTQLLQRDIQAALADEGVKSLLLVIDSPGGTVDGTQAAAQVVRNAATQKPMAAIADGRMASGAYWIGSAVGKGNLFITDDTTVVGSIGVVAAHVDRSEAERRAGLKVTEITSGAYKRIASEHAPLTREGFDAIKEVTDHIYTVFVNEVAANRGSDPETVLKDMADGRVFLGRKAITAGLVDDVATVPAVVALLKQRAAGANTVGAPAPGLKGDSHMDKVLILGAACATQEAVDAAVTAAVTAAEAKGNAAGKTAAQTDVDAKVQAAAKTERDRILAVEANAMPGHEKLIAELKADGKTTGPEAAQRILAAEKGKLAQVATDLKTDAPKPAPASEGTQADTKTKDADPAKVAQLARQYQVEQAKVGNVISTTDAVAHVMAQQK
jgi:signal peptide peptidase SppA